jgi:hypothetical protein
VVRVVMSIGAVLVVVLLGVIALLALDHGTGSDSFTARVVSVSMRQPGLAPSQMVCATGNGGKFCTAVAPSEPGAPFKVGDCVSIANEGIAVSGFQPTSCD